MSSRYPPHDSGRSPYHYSDPFNDPHSTAGRHSQEQTYDGSARLGGDLSGGQQRYQLSDSSSYVDSSATLPTGSFATLPGVADDDKSYGMHQQEDDDEARPLRDEFQGGGGGFYRPEGEQ